MKTRQQIQDKLSALNDALIDSQKKPNEFGWDSQRVIYELDHESKIAMLEWVLDDPSDEVEE